MFYIMLNYYRYKKRKDRESKHFKALKRMSVVGWERAVQRFAEVHP